MNPELPRQLSARLEQPLPGWRAQARYQPELSMGRHRGPARADARPAAVLVALYPHGDAWHLPLMLRPAHMVDHAGQVSLPGGTIEPGESSRQAALREFQEELGVETAGMEVLGQLSELYLFASNFRITPWVAVLDHKPDWHPSQREVARLLEVPLLHLLDPGNTGHVERRQRGLGFRAPCFVWDTERIWGATSMVLAELVDMLGEIEL